MQAALRVHEAKEKSGKRRNGKRSRQRNERKTEGTFFHSAQLNNILIIPKIATSSSIYWRWRHVIQYSRSISFLSLCLTQWGVDDCGQPSRVWSQKEHTEASRVKARLSETLDLAVYGQWSLSVSKSVWYSIKYALINTASSISTGRSLTDVYSNKLQHRLYFSYCSVRSFQLIYTTQLIHNTSICLFTRQQHITW